MKETEPSNRDLDERSAKLNGPKIQKWTVLRPQSERSMNIKVDDPKGRK